MWDTVKVIIGLIIGGIIGLIIFGIATLAKLWPDCGPVETPVFIVVGLILFFVYDLAHHK